MQIGINNNKYTINREALLEEARKASRRQLDEWKQAQDIEPEAKKTVEVEVDDVIPVRLLQTSKYADDGLFFNSISFSSKFN